MSHKRGIILDLEKEQVMKLTRGLSPQNRRKARRMLLLSLQDIADAKVESAEHESDLHTNGPFGTMP